jgi:hypothetical protein
MKGREAKVFSLKKNRHRMRIHWVPHFVPMEVIVGILENRSDIKVTNSFNEKNRRKGFEHVFTLVRTMVINTEYRLS